MVDSTKVAAAENEWRNENEPLQAIVNLEIYHELLKRKKRFLIRAIIFFICFYFALPLSIIFFPRIMAAQLFSHFTLAWILAILQFLMVWGLATLYYFKAKQFDLLAEKSISRRPRS